MCQWTNIIICIGNDEVQWMSERVFEMIWNCASIVKKFTFLSTYECCCSSVQMEHFCHCKWFEHTCLQIILSMCNVATILVVLVRIGTYCFKHTAIFVSKFNFLYVWSNSVDGTRSAAGKGREQVHVHSHLPNAITLKDVFLQFLIIFATRSESRVAIITLWTWTPCIFPFSSLYFFPSAWTWNRK